MLLELKRIVLIHQVLSSASGRSLFGLFKIWVPNTAFLGPSVSYVPSLNARDKGKQAKQLGFDHELIFLACMLHEWGSPMKALRARCYWSSGAPWNLQMVPRPTKRFWERRNVKKLLTTWVDEACESIARHTIEFAGSARDVELRCTGHVRSWVRSYHLWNSVMRSCIEDMKIVCELCSRNRYCDGLRHHSEK